MNIEFSDSHSPHLGDDDEDIFDVNWPDEKNLDTIPMEKVHRPLGVLTRIVDEHSLVCKGYLKSKKVKFGLQKLLSQKNRDTVKVK